MSKIYELIIIGAGPAGITASVYAARQKMDFLVITDDIGGQTAWSGGVENYTGYQFISGPDLVSKFEGHMKQYDIKLKENEKVINILNDKDIIHVKTHKKEYKTRTIIVSSGKKSKQLNVPGEEKFKNKGLTYCATCDGPLFSGKEVAVVGGGNSGLDSTLQLVKIARHVYIIDISSSLTGDKIMQDKVRESKKVSVLNKTQVTAILGDKMVDGIKIKTEGKEEILQVQGVFVEIGLIPNSDFIDLVEKNNKKEIKVNCSARTNIKNIFAAGDVTDVPEKQIIIAAGDGAKAALGAFRYLTQFKN